MYFYLQSISQMIFNSTSKKNKKKFKEASRALQTAKA
jgi:hypothetical protein